MKHILSLFLVIGVLSNFSAYGQCDLAFDKACSLFKSGRYKEAKMQFEWCSAHCKDHSEATYTGWLNKCDKQIQKQERVATGRRKAEAAAIAKQEAAAIALAERREKNRYVYLSSSSAVHGKFTNMEYELEDKIREINPEIKFTRDSAEAYWYVRVVVNTYPHPVNGDIYYVEATMEVENAATAEAIRSRVSEKGSSSLEENKEETVADKIYSKRKFFADITNSIIKSIKQ